MANNKILMGCCNYWSSPFQVGSHHLARGFLKHGWEVAFISDPISPLHWLGSSRAQLRERYALYRQGGVRQADGRLWAYVPGALLTPFNKPLLRSGWVMEHWPALTLPSAARTARENGFGRVDLIYLDSTAQGFWLEAVEHRKSVFRIADRYSEFHKATPITNAREQAIAQAVDLVVYSAVSLRSYVESLRPRQALHVPNGVNVAHFRDYDGPRPAEYENIPGPIVVYLGAMDVWFDFDLLAAAARALPDASFVLIGPDDLARERLAQLPNVHRVGHKPYRDLPAYLHHADVGIIPFNRRDYPLLVDHIHPLKLYEYLACGLPVVSMRWEELQALQSPALLCDTADEFIEGIRAALATPADRQALVDFAGRQDWSRRVAQLAAALDLPA